MKYCTLEKRNTTVTYLYQVDPWIDLIDAMWQQAGAELCQAYTKIG